MRQEQRVDTILTVSLPIIHSAKEFDIPSAFLWKEKAVVLAKQIYDFKPIFILLSCCVYVLH
jgi:hypothetical protein